MDLKGEIPSYYEDVDVKRGRGGSPVDIKVDQKIDVENAALAEALGGANKPNPWVKPILAVLTYAVLTSMEIGEGI